MERDVMRIGKDTVEKLVEKKEKEIERRKEEERGKGEFKQINTVSSLVHLHIHTGV